MRYLRYYFQYRRLRRILAERKDYVSYNVVCEHIRPDKMDVMARLKDLEERGEVEFGYGVPKGHTWLTVLPTVFVKLRKADK